MNCSNCELELVIGKDEGTWTFFGILCKDCWTKRQEGISTLDEFDKTLEKEDGS